MNHRSTLVDHVALFGAVALVASWFGSSMGSPLHGDFITQPARAAAATPGVVPGGDGEAAHRYAIYFERANAKLTPEGRAIVDAAAAVARDDPDARVHVVSTAPFAVRGADAKALARRYADAVMAELKARGIAEGRIDERLADALVPATPGIIDPSQRMVEVTVE